MTLFGNGFRPWDLFQIRIEIAIFRAADEHQGVDILLTDLRLCEGLLRERGDSTSNLRTLDTPVANELCDALEAHAAEDPMQYGQTCAANVVLAVMNAIALEDTGG